MDVRKGNEFIRKLVKLILDDAGLVGSGKFVQQNQNKLIEFLQPKQLEAALDLSIKREGQNEASLLNFCQKIISHSLKTTHPNFYNQLYGGVEEFGLSGAWLTDALNTSAATYEISPVFTLMERELIKYLGKLIGYEQNTIDGMFSPGGSMANMYGMVLARQHLYPEAKQKGIRELGDIVMFASEDSHYSFVKGAIWLGHGSESVIKIKTDASGQMIPGELEKEIIKSKEKGKTPFLVAATSGTTVLGAFDPLEQISSICKKHNLWFHVDAALGGTILFSRKHKHLLKGIDQADSVTWDLHKMGCTPLQCTLVITKHPNILFQTNSLKAEYIFQSDKYYDASYDSGDKSIQCGRKVDSLKLWMMLQAYGEEGIEQAVDNVFEMAGYITEKLKSRPGFELVLPSFQSNNICFWYTPPAMRNCRPLSKELISAVAPALKKQMMEKGTLMIGYQPLTTKQLPNFFRLVLSCFPKSTKMDMDFIIEEIERLGQNLNITN